MLVLGLVPNYSDYSCLVMMMMTIRAYWPIWNDNMPFKRDSFNKAEPEIPRYKGVQEGWIPQSEPLTLNSNPLSIGRVGEWGCVNAISIPVYVKGGT